MIKRLFKNIPLILAVFGITFALTGCGGTSSPASNNNNIVNGGNGNNGTPPVGGRLRQGCGVIISRNGLKDLRQLPHTISPMP